MEYDEKYFREGNYTDYLSRKGRYHQLAADIDRFLDTICERKLHRPILDFGCAVGFLVDGFFERGYTDVTGYDTSTWAVDRASRYGIRNITQSLDHRKRRYHVVTMLDVLEHIDHGDVKVILKYLYSNIIIVRIPVASVIGGPLFYECSRRDPTHINVQTKEEWINVFARAGYRFCVSMNLPNMWDSEGVMCSLFRRDI